MPNDGLGVSEAFKAIGDPIRWQIVEQIATQTEYPCAELEDMLPVSKPTISYHVKILTQVGLVAVTKRGRNYYYTLRGEVLEQMIGELQHLVPGLRLVGETAPAPRRSPRPVNRPAGELAEGTTGRLLTW
jgi:DNA-binding transcriptional ArsR family regulator